jgi:ABC-2 type transport system permease protein
MNFRIIEALVMRYLYLYTRTPIRLVELVFWPLVGLLVWGFVSRYISENSGDAMPYPATFLIGAVILWDVLFRAQQGVAIYFLEDVWTRNLLNLFAAPVRLTEYLAATYTIGMLRAIFTVTTLSMLSALLYAFNVFDLHWQLLPFVLNLLVFGWSLGMISTALILRWGPAAESLAWAVPFFIQPVAAVFYPVSVLPPALQAVAHALPCAYIFEGMRDALANNPISGRDLLMASGLNVVYLAAAGLLFSRVMLTARERGLLTKFASQ